MKEKLQLFAENTKAMSVHFKWHDGTTRRLAALLYTQQNKRVDPIAIKQSLDIIKRNTGMFSTFRGNMVLCIATLLSLSENPQDLFHQTQIAYNALKNVKLRSSDFLVVAAFQIANQSQNHDFNNVALRTKEFYDKLKSRSFFATGQADYIYAAMLGLSDLNVSIGMERIDIIMSAVKGKLSANKSSIQALSQILALGNSCEQTVNRVFCLRDALRANKIRLDKSDTLPTLGILALLPAEDQDIVQNITEGAKILRGYKGFGAWSVSTQELLIYVAAITATQHTQNSSDIVTAAVSTSIANIIIAQQMAMMAAVVVSSTAVTTSSNC